MSSSEVSPRHVRPDMVASAVSFLQDPKVQQSNVSQRVSFLESKGLSPDEIDEALRQTGSSGAITAGQAAHAGPSHSVYPQQQAAGPPVYYNSYGGPQQQGYYPQPSASVQRDRDWRDWFIMAVVSGTVGYGVIALARKYLFPHLQPPNQTVLEEDKDALTAKYDEVAAQLSALDAETKAVKQGIEAQREAVEKSIKEVEDTVRTMRDADKKRGKDMDDVKSDVETMKRDMERMFERTKEAQTASLAELQNELKSLKSLLASRAGGTTPAGVAASRPYSPFGQQQNGGQDASAGTGNGIPASTSAPANGVGGISGSVPAAKPSIPAWQLADNSSTSNSPPASSSGAAASSTAAADEPLGSSPAQAGSDHANAQSTAS